MKERNYGFAKNLYFTSVCLFVDPKRPESTHACKTIIAHLFEQN